MVRYSKDHIAVDSLFKPMMEILTHIYFSAPVEIDEYDLVDPVDILTPLEKSGFWDGVVRDLSWMHALLVTLLYEK